MKNKETKQETKNETNEIKHQKPQKAKKQKMNFIRTTDVDTAKYLRECGLTEITEPNSSTYCFLNNLDQMTFEEDEKQEEIQKKIHYTNILHI